VRDRVGAVGRPHVSIAAPRPAELLARHIGERPVVDVVESLDAAVRQGRPRAHQEAALSLARSAHAHEADLLYSGVPVDHPLSLGRAVRSDVVEPTHRLTADHPRRLDDVELRQLRILLKGRIAGRDAPASFQEREARDGRIGHDGRGGLGSEGTGGEGGNHRPGRKLAEYGSSGGGNNGRVRVGGAQRLPVLPAAGVGIVAPVVAHHYVAGEELDPADVHHLEGPDAIAGEHHPVDLLGAVVVAGKSLAYRDLPTLHHTVLGIDQRLAGDPPLELDENARRCIGIARHPTPEVVLRRAHRAVVHVEGRGVRGLARGARRRARTGPREALPPTGTLSHPSLHLLEEVFEPGWVAGPGRSMERR
jgi:hypothetical protein